MTDKAKKLENLKQEIRSVLLTQPTGFTISGLLGDYRSIIGQALPFREFGYPTHEDFLRSIPDVVSMHWSSRYDTYTLKAVADETTKHIEKLVSRQKKSGKSAIITAPRNPSVVGPRFNPRYRSYSNKSFVRQYMPISAKNEIFSVAREFRNGLNLPNFLTAFRRKYGKELVYKNFGFYTLEDCLNAVPEVFLRCECGEMRIYPIIEKQTEPSTAAVYSDAWKPTQDGSRLVQNSSANGSNDNKENQPVNNLVTDNASCKTSEKLTEKKTMDVLDDFSCQDEHSDNSGISPAFREKFKEVMKNNSQGIWVTQFPEAFWKLTGHNLDHRKFGYYNLVDLFNDLPEIFRIEVFEGCKDDWMLFDATRAEESFKPKEGSENKPVAVKKVSSDVFEVVKNIRLLLQASSEGVSFDDFSSLYEANCDEQFSLIELGFDSLPVFFDTIAGRVPLKIDDSGKKPRVWYKKEETSQAISTRVSPQLELPSDIPSDAIVGHCEYKLQQIPEDLNAEKFFPVYLSAVVDPSHMYIQLRREDTSMVLESLMDKLELFYYSQESDCYKMPMHYIMSGAICAAVWPSDGRWHRIRIFRVPSNDTVVAFFVDYGTKERIPSNNLKFLKKKFMELPAQAIRSHLCRLSPVQGGNWDPRARNRILNSFGKEPLMACLTQRPIGEESLSLILCDVSGVNDVFLNDLLVSEGLAEYMRDEQDVSNHEQSCDHDPNHFRAEELTSPLSYQKPPLQQPPEMPVLPGNMPGNLLQMMSLINAPSMRDYDVQNSNNPNLINLLSNFNNGDTASLHPLVVKQLQALQINNSMPNKPATSSPTQPTVSNSVPNFSPPSLALSTQDAAVNSYHVSHESDSDEIFESDEEVDDDDNPEVNSISKRYVKRVILDDGYEHVHMIVIDDRPYMSSGDITFLLWNNGDPNFVRRKLKIKEISIPSNTLNEVGYEQLFYQLGRFQVKGIKTEATGHSYITLFPFKNVIDILNIFGHPSVAVRDIIDHELLQFNPLDSFWKTISEEEYEENPFDVETRNEKEQKVCLYELKASLQALKFRKQTLKNQLYSSATIPGLGDEIEKIETQCGEVERHIRDLQVKVVSHQRERGFD